MMTLTVREWFRGMRHGDGALMFAADVEHALTQRDGPVYSHVRGYNVTLVFDLAAFERWQHKQFLIRHLVIE